ncbi:MAG: molybdopterin biosynthesis protein [Candidatus Methanoperedens sp.]|nr:molybdopterin biosynthesis protein [Candidatus Methanoperedens nitroreducens]MDJ1420535.1 molybdopterin biosynthesis protein [Candidatus Methanoperedens sp.]
MQKEFRKLVTIDEAKGIIERMDIRPGIIEVNIENASGYALAQDVISDVDVPPFSRASMDGYAVHAADTYSAREDRPVHLNLVGSIPAGINPDIHIKRGEAAEIATGAVMPSGADAVVMVEHTRIGTSLSVHRPVSINENVMHAGTDIMAGERVLRRGTVLGTREIGILAAVGKMAVNIYGLVVGIISTGNELVRPGCKLDAGKIYDINSFSISAGVKQCGGTPVLYPAVRDDRTEMMEALREAAENCDIILTSGSTSAGSGDVMYRIIEENGTVLAHGIDIKPGKPAIIGIVFGKPVFGLPGYPASSLTIFNEFVAPLIRKITGKKEERIRTTARLAVRVRSEGRSQLLPVGLVRGWAYPIEKGSGAITTLSEADGFIEIQQSVEMIEAGEAVDVTLFGEIETPDLLFVGSHCLGLDALIDTANLRIRVINAGSSGGLVAIRSGIADIAGVHLLDESGIYNIPFLERFGIRNAVVVKGYLREQGLIVRKDSTIRGFEDIIHVRVINRNTGSGTRVMTDLKLRDISRQRGIPFEELTASMSGYHTEAKTHSAVASAIRLGKADAGVGIRTVAELNGLKFIKIADEEYDFVIPIKLLESREIQIFLRALRSYEPSEKLPPGLRTYERTGEIVRIS